MTVDMFGRQCSECGAPMEGNKQKPELWRCTECDNWYIEIIPQLSETWPQCPACGMFIDDNDEQELAPNGSVKNFICKRCGYTEGGE